MEIRAVPGDRLTRAIWLSGKLAAPPLCAGLGMCGRCRLRFLDHIPEPRENDLAFFTPEEIATGWRLACQHLAPECEYCRLELPRESFRIRDQENIILPRGADRVFLGIDLGTTTIQWRAFNCVGAAFEGSAPNPQAAAGADVISRLEIAAADDRPAQMALYALEDIFDRLAVRNLAISRVCVAGNTAMTAIMLNKNLDGLRFAPWRLDYCGGEIIHLNLHGTTTEIVIPPLYSPFVGGDISAGILALIESDTPRPFLLADLGTNAELALLDNRDKLFIASAPLGPAMEGIGPTCGQPAGNDVITGFTLGPMGLEPRFMNNSFSEKCAGISATGYISLLAILLRIGVLNGEGNFQKIPAMPIGRKVALGLEYARGMPELSLPGGMRLTANDVEMILKVKAAFSTALSMLLDSADLDASAIASFRLAGALGQYANPEDLDLLGFVPHILATRLLAAGNTSLAGACILAARPEKLDILKKLGRNARTIQLAENPGFMDKYLAAMRWDY